MQGYYDGRPSDATVIVSQLKRTTTCISTKQTRQSYSDLVLHHCFVTYHHTVELWDWRESHYVIIDSRSLYPTTVHLIIREFVSWKQNVQNFRA